MVEPSIPRLDQAHILREGVEDTFRLSLINDPWPISIRIVVLGFAGARIGRAARHHLLDYVWSDKPYDQPGIRKRFHSRVGYMTEHPPNQNSIDERLRRKAVRFQR